MTKAKLVLGSVLGAAALICGGVAVAQKPVEDISGKKHSNLAAAQHLSQQAWEKITAAQQANEWDMQGHAAKAKELLDQVNQELKLSAEAANRNHK
jgi:outer membrane murein-binding lipoprotein Lpp